MKEQILKITDDLRNEEITPEYARDLLLCLFNVSGSLPKTEAEIRFASNAIYNNKNLTYSYREDVIAVLDWVLGGEPFDGLDKQ